MKKPHPHSAEAVMERCENQIAEIRTLAHILLGRLAFSFDLSRGVVDGETVTLKFQQESIHTTDWVAGKIWSAAADLDDFLGEARNAQTEAEENGRTLA